MLCDPKARAARAAAQIDDRLSVFNAEFGGNTLKKNHVYRAERHEPVRQALRRCTDGFAVYAASVDRQVHVIEAGGHVHDVTFFPRPTLHPPRFLVGRHLRSSVAPHTLLGSQTPRNADWLDDRPHRVQAVRSRTGPDATQRELAVFSRHLSNHVGEPSCSNSLFGAIVFWGIIAIALQQPPPRHAHMER